MTELEKLLKRREAVKSGRGIADGERAVTEPSGAVADTDTARLAEKQELKLLIAEQKKDSGAERENRNAERERQRAIAKQEAIARERAEVIRQSKAHERSRGFER